MTTERALARSDDTQAAVWTEDKKQLLKDQIAPQATDGELELFIAVCQRTGLDPFARQIYAIHRRSKDRNGNYQQKMTIQTSIDGFRLIANRTGEYAGQVGPYWCGEDGDWKDVWLSKQAPAAAKVGVLRKGWEEPAWGIAHWDEYAQTYNGKASGMWANMPRTMIAKCAEALALRKAFPQEMSGVYAAEEMHQADNTMPDPQPQPKPRRSQPRKPESIAPPSEAEMFEDDEAIEGEYTEVEEQPAPKQGPQKSGDASDPTQYLDEVVAEAGVEDNLGTIIFMRYNQSGSMDDLTKDQQRNLFRYMRLIAGLKKASSYNALSALYERHAGDSKLWDDFAQEVHDDRLAELTPEPATVSA